MADHCPACGRPARLMPRRGTCYRCYRRAWSAGTLPPLALVCRCATRPARRGRCHPCYERLRRSGRLDPPPCPRARPGAWAVVCGGSCWGEYPTESAARAEVARLAAAGRPAAVERWEG